MFAMVKKLGIFILGAGILLALLQMFGGDPFALLQWVGEWIWHAIEKVRDFFLGNKEFRNATKAPKN